MQAITLNHPQVMPLPLVKWSLSIVLYRLLIVPSEIYRGKDNYYRTQPMPLISKIINEVVMFAANGGLENISEMLCIM